METILTNTTKGQVRRVTRNGRSYLVARSTLIVPGVLNGSKGPLYYPLDEMGKNPSDWNGVPLLLGHPIRNGIHVSGRDPDVLENQGLGYVYRTNAKGKLTAEAWFDEEAVRRVDSRILDRLEAGESIELSTGLGTDNERAENGASYNGRKYVAVARNYKPDHVAVLPDQVGACSIADGCGVLVNQGWQPIANEPSDSLDISPDKACQIIKDGCGVLVNQGWQAFNTDLSEAPDDVRKAAFAAMAEDKGGSAKHFDVQPARYAKGQVAVKVTAEGGGYKTRAHRVVEGHGGRWSGREGAYIMSPRKAEKAIASYQAGKDWSPITGDWRKGTFTGNSASHIPLHAAAAMRSSAGQWSPVGSGTGKGDVHEAAKKGRKHTGDEGDRSPASLFPDIPETMPEIQNSWQPLANAYNLVEK